MFRQICQWLLTHRIPHKLPCTSFVLCLFVYFGSSFLSFDSPCDRGVVLYQVQNFNLYDHEATLDMCIRYIALDTPKDVKEKDTRDASYDRLVPV